MTKLDRTRPLRKLQSVGLILISLLFLTSGTLHFLATPSFVKIVPPYIPHPQAAVYISGIAELAGAIGLQIPRLRRIAAWGLVALLVAVFPANIDMAANSIQLGAHPIPSWILWVRLPLQPVLIYWLLRSAGLLPGGPRQLSS